MWITGGCPFWPGRGNKSPQTLNGSPVGLALYGENVDDVFKRAMEAGATVKKPVGDKFWGDRAGSVIDPFGHYWTILTHKEDVSVDEMKKQMEKMFANKECAWAKRTDSLTAIFLQKERRFSFECSRPF